MKLFISQSAKNSLIVSSIRRVYKSNAFWTAMLDESKFKSGPFDGGCLVCAKALIRVFGGSLVRIVNSSKNTTEHYGALIDGGIYDFDGFHSSPNKWMQTFEKHEHTGRDLYFAEGFDKKSVIPNDPDTELKVADLLKSK